MRVLVVGSGGREHALTWGIGASPLCDKLYCAPGNAGIAEEAECVPIAADNIERLVAFAVDQLSSVGIKAFGPSAAAAVLEGSKGFMKDLAAHYGIPTAAYARFREPEARSE